MPHFRDKTFCNKSDCDNAETCPDFLSDHLKKCSEKVGLPVSFMHEPECFRTKKVVKDVTRD